MSTESHRPTSGTIPQNTITEVKIFKTGRSSKTLAYANITLFDIFVVKNLRIVQGSKGVFIGMPSLKMKDGNYRDIFFPIKQEARELITETLLKAYEEQTGEKITDMQSSNEKPSD